MKNSGGPAFPVDPALLRKPTSLGDDIELRREARGMTLRDYFAGQALISIGPFISLPDFSMATAQGRAARALWAYAQADAMLEERGR